MAGGWANGHGAWGEGVSCMQKSMLPDFLASWDVAWICVPRAMWSVRAEPRRDVKGICLLRARCSPGGAPGALRTGARCGDVVRFEVNACRDYGLERCSVESLTDQCRCRCQCAVVLAVPTPTVSNATYSCKCTVGDGISENPYTVLRTAESSAVNSYSGVNS